MSSDTTTTVTQRSGRTCIAPATRVSAMMIASGAKRSARSQLAADGVARHPGQLDVEQDEVERLGERAVAPARAVRLHRDRVPIGLERVDEELDVHAVVVDEQDAHALTPASPRDFCFASSGL